MVVLESMMHFYFHVSKFYRINFFVVVLESIEYLYCAVLLMLHPS